jgi:hypothetical protein
LDERELEQRKKGLEIYLKTLLNEKIYFIQCLFDFIEFDSSKCRHFDNASQIDIEIGKYRAVPMGPSEIMDLKQQYTVYRFRLEPIE